MKKRKKKGIIAPIPAAYSVLIIADGNYSGVWIMSYGKLLVIENNISLLPRLNKIARQVQLYTLIRGTSHYG